MLEIMLKLKEHKLFMESELITIDANSNHEFENMSTTFKYMKKKW